MNKFIFYIGGALLALSAAIPIPDPLSLLVAIIALAILVIGGGNAVYKECKIRRYKPEITEKYAEGTVLTYFNQNGEVITKKPCVYIFIKLDPKDQIIRLCEVKVADDWYAYFNTAGYDRYDVQREENLHLGRYEIDVTNKTIQFVRPIHEAELVRRYGGWVGKKAELENGKAELNIVGEVNGKKIEVKVPIEINVKDLLSRRKWQPEWIEAEKPLIDSADKIIDEFIATL